MTSLFLRSKKIIKLINSNQEFKKNSDVNNTNSEGMLLGILYYLKQFFSKIHIFIPHLNIIMSLCFNF